MAKKVFVFLADGFEEVEAVTPVDYLRRAGLETLTISISKSKTVEGSHKIPVTADALISEINAEDADCIVLPGGMPGTTNLAASKELDGIIRDFAQKKKLIAAICAAPALVLGAKGLLAGRRFTCYPGMEEELKKSARWENFPVVEDGNIITSRGAGTAGVFSLEIIKKLLSAERALEIKTSVVM